jgi:CO/xanthine dehydrogenase FAD-binding subunit
MELEDFFLGPRRSAIARDEILTHVIIPDQPATGSWYYKFGLRRSRRLRSLVWQLLLWLTDCMLTARG